MRRQTVLGFVICTLLVVAPLSSSVATNYKVYPGVLCVPDRQDTSDYSYENGAFKQGSTQCVSAFCPIHRDEVWDSNWDELKVFVDDANSSGDNIECTAEVLKSDGSRAPTNSVYTMGSGTETISIPDPNSSAGSWALYGFVCTFPSSDAGDKHAIFGYRVEE